MHKPRTRAKKPPKRTPALPHLEHAKTSVLYSLTSASQAPGDLLSSSDLAKQVLHAVSEFDAHLMNLLSRAKAVEPSDEYEKLKFAIGHVLAETGERLIAPIHRRHQELIPEALRGELL